MARRVKTFGGQEETLPIKDPKQIDALLSYFIIKRDKAKSDIKKFQADRNYMLCLVGFNTAFRAEDLLQLKKKQLNGYVHIKENKTGKMQNFKMNKDFYQEVQDYCNRWGITDNEYLYMGQKKKQTYDGKTYPIILPITRQQAHRLVSKAGDAIGIDFVFGLHSLRKTFGYQYLKNGGNPETLMKMYNHDDYDYTKRYTHWGIEDAEADRAAMYIGLKKRTPNFNNKRS
ncbi:MAG: tyrosine-type recombinase/integrase [Bacilli bacterium]|nr:tyrosine-type recombinase/integrase [Bacilli bacterium]